MCLQTPNASDLGLPQKPENWNTMSGEEQHTWFTNWREENKDWNPTGLTIGGLGAGINSAINNIRD